MSQTFINPDGQPVGRAGEIADNANVRVESGFNGEASAAIPFGVAVKVDSTEASGRSVKNLASINDAVDSISALDFDRQTGTTGDLDANGAVIPKGKINRLVKGKIYVTVEEAVNPGDRAFVRAVVDTPGGFLTLGAFRKSQDVIAGPVNSCIDVTRNAVFRTGAAAGALAVVDVDFTIKS